MSKHDFFPKGKYGEVVFFVNGMGDHIICTLEKVLEIAANGNNTDPIASAEPSQQQAKEAVSKLRLQMN